MSDVYFNGVLVGTVDKLSDFAEELKVARRTNKVSPYLNFKVNQETDSITVLLDKDRVRRPLIVIKDGKSLLTEDLKDKLISGEKKWDDLLRDGIIEYLDAAEEEDCLIALDDSRITKNHTHLEISPLVIFGLSTSLVPYNNFGPSPRLLFGQKIHKQALGCYAANYHIRSDTNENILHYPQKPLVQSFTQSILRDIRSSGQNVVIAVINYDGYNMNDAVVINKHSLQRGFGRSTHFEPYVAERLRYPGGQTDEIKVPDKDVDGYTIEDDYRFLNEDGVIYPEADVKGNEVLIGKTSPPRFLGKLETFSTTANTRKDSSVRIKPNETGIVSDVILTESQEGNLLVKIKVREDRMPELGDKMSSRHGQKGVIGHIVNAKDMPFTADGLVPDIVFSPNGLFRRMTVNHMIEILGGKVSALAGRYINGTAFESEPSEELRKELFSLGFKENGTETMYDGRTGKQYAARIYIGNMYYLRLYLQVADKLQARARGPVQLLTRQPTEGKAKEGGTRLGEMEKETLVGHGASLLMKERFDSDRTTCYVCEKCGSLATFDHFKNKPICLSCEGKSTTSLIETSYAFKLFLDELKSMCIKPRLILKEKY